MDKYQETKNKYRREKVDRIEVIVPKGEREKINEYAKKQSKSTSNYIFDLIKKDMDNN